jgi:ubiquinol-cytochrome c reductase iron-sulfur subunit
MMEQGGSSGAQGSTTGAVAALVLAAVLGVGATIAFWLGEDGPLFGALAAASLLLFGSGLVWWGAQAMPGDVVSDEREPLESTPEERAAFVEDFVRGREGITRRRLLAGSVMAVAGSYAALGLSLLRSLSPEVDPILRHTAWERGARLVTSEGLPLKPDDLRIGGVLTVYPQGHVSAADSQTLLIRVRPDELQLPPERLSWTRDGLVAYSKICTHAACPVGLYQEREHLLLCPCHQSTFDVLRGARPIAGPAARPLPQLPLDVDESGYLVAQADYATPVGPGFWNMPEGG